MDFSHMCPKYRIVERSVEDGRPVAVTYCLTARGHDLRPVIAAYQTWADKWIFTTTPS